jgi:hypothetical protein
MRTLGQPELAQEMGAGYAGEVRTGPDNRPYQWVQTVDGLGNPVGFWRGMRRVARGVRRVTAPALRVAQQVAPLVPGAGPAMTSAVRAATPVLRRAGLAGHHGIGALYQAPDGSLYRNASEPESEELQAQGQDGRPEDLDMGYPGEVRLGADGRPYQWVQGVDGLGNPVGFWRGLRRAARTVRRAAAPALRVVQQAAPLVPGVGPPVATALRAAAPVLRRAGVAGQDGLGALYQAPDGSLYHVEAQDQGLPSVAEQDDAAGSSEATEGLSQDEELQRVAEDEEMQDLAEDQELQGLDQGYVREDQMGDLDAYVSPQPATTRRFVRPAQPPVLWKPLW